MPNSNFTKKTKGRVYTPSYIVKNILDLSHYIGNNIFEKHVIDNSCGDGAFLCEIIERYCDFALKQKIDTALLKKHLEHYIHGIEIDPIEHKKCIENVNNIVRKYGITTNVSWDIICADTLSVNKYDGKMDFVLGNPPYVRVHNLNNSFDSVKKFLFTQNGMTDLFIVFYEIGLKMLNQNGVLGYITPSSFFNSLAGAYMRKHLVQQKLIEKIVDLKHFQAFNATTYTTIVILNKQKKLDTLEYYQFDEKNLIPYYVETLASSDYYISQNFYFSTKQNLSLLKKIFTNLGLCNIEVKNGYATLCDEVFIGSFKFKSKYIIPTIKASRGETKQMIYPYDRFGKLIPLLELKKETDLYNYLLENKEKLSNRSIENNQNTAWYAFGRSQAINDTYKNKIAINALLRTSNDLRIILAPEGTGVYSGLYLVGPDKDLEKIPSLLNSQEFSLYISLLSKYKSGGYYTFSSKDIKAFLNYKLAYNKGIL